MTIYKIKMVRKRWLKEEEVKIGLLIENNKSCELPTHGKADGMGFRSHHSNQCWQFVLIFNCQFLTELFF
jgi:hypothetical protein